MEKNMTRNIIGVYVGMYILLIITQFILVFFTRIDFSDEMVNLVVSGVINLSFYVSLFIIYALLFKRFWLVTFKNFKSNFFLRVSQIIMGVVGIFVASTLVSYLYRILDVSNTSDNQASLNLMLEGPLFTRVSLVIFSVFLAPVVEEMVFRFAGFRLLKNGPAYSVIILTSLAFGFIHVMGDDLVQIIYYAGLGVALGTVYHYSKNILVPIGVHMLFNGIVMLVMFSS